MFKNKFSKQMYFLLNNFDKNKDMHKSIELLANKYSIKDYQAHNVLYECVINNFITGIVVNKKLNGKCDATFTQNIYITLNGYDFIKNYYSFIKKILWDLLLAIIVATITVFINKYFSTPNDSIKSIDKITTNS